MRWFLNIFPIPFGMLNFIAEKYERIFALCDVFYCLLDAGIYCVNIPTSIFNEFRTRHIAEFFAAVRK